MAIGTLIAVVRGLAVDSNSGRVVERHALDRRQFVRLAGSVLLAACSSGTGHPGKDNGTEPASQSGNDNAGGDDGGDGGTEIPPRSMVMPIVSWTRSISLGDVGRDP